MYFMVCVVQKCELALISPKWVSFHSQIAIIFVNMLLFFREHIELCFAINMRTHQANNL